MPSSSQLPPPVISDDIALVRVQQRYDAPVNQMLATPWGNGVLVRGIPVAGTAQPQAITLRHGLGRAPTGVVIWNASVEVIGPWGLTAVDANTARVNVALPHGAPGTLDLWVA